MNIVFDAERMKYPHTGLFTYCLELGQQLKEYALNSGDRISFFAPPAVGKIFGENETYLMQHPLQKFLLPDLKKFHLWHATYQSSDYVPRANKKIKVVLTIHDLNFIYDQAKTATKKQKHLRHLQSNINRSDAIVCISRFCKNDVLRHCETGNKPVYMIHNGTNNLQTAALEKHSYRPKSPFLFSLGCVNRKKNFHVLLHLVQQNQDMELIIAGRPEDADYIRFIHQQAQCLGIADQVRVIGTISETEKSWYYANCYAFSLPSLSEGFGLPVTEAMSFGKPVFLSQLTALPEIGSDAAFYFNEFEADHMQQVFASGMQQYQRESMSGLIKKRSTDFCWKQAATKYLQVYHSLY